MDVKLVCIVIIDAYQNNYAQCQDCDEKDCEVGYSVSVVERNGVVIL